MFDKTKKNLILESPFICDMLKLLKHDSWLILDLDNTVMESLLELGSDQWFTQLISYACEVIPDQEEAISSVIAVYHAVQQHVRAKPVEPTIVKLIRALQDIHIPVFGLTARDPILSGATHRQLGEIGIDLHNKLIFCGGQDKGLCLKKFLVTFKQPPAHIVMVDDKEKHLLSVKNTAETLGIRFSGLRYGFLDEKVKNLDIKNAHHQLAHIKNKLSSSTQVIIEKLKITPHTILVQTSEYAEFFVFGSPQQARANSKHTSLLCGENKEVVKGEEQEKQSLFRK